MGGVSGWTGTVHQKPAQPQLNLTALLEHIFFSMERTEHTLLTELQWFRLWKEKTKLSTQNRWKLINIHIFKVPLDVGLHFLQKKPHFLLAENTDSLELNLSSILFFSPEKHIFSNSVAKVFFPDPFRISTQNYSKGRRLKFLTASTDDGPTVTVDIGGERH